ncbi:hypothetical protein OROGR_026608 [Orobanche gracilis]
MAAYDAIGQGGDVRNRRNRASSGAFLSAISSRSESSGSYTPAQFREPVAGGESSSRSNGLVIYDRFGKQLPTDEQSLAKYISADSGDLMAMYKKQMDRGAVSTKKKSHVLCYQCYNHHPRYAYCPYRRPCNICYKPHDPASVCPYFIFYPQGAPFNRVSYEIVCDCGNEFNEAKWVCTYCGRSKALLVAKYCSFCKIGLQHSSHECPKNRVLAAQYKSIRDELMLRAPSLLEKKTISFEDYVPQRRKSYSSEEDDFP